MNGFLSNPFVVWVLFLLLLASLVVPVLMILYDFQLPMPRWLRLPLFRHTLSRYQWYRGWYGGRWEYWFIEMCMSAFWLHMPDKEFQYPHYYPCSGRGTPIVEDYDVRE